MGVLDGVAVKGQDKMPWVIGTLDNLYHVSGSEHVGITISLLGPVEVISYLETVVVFLITVDNVAEDGQAIGGDVQLTQEGFDTLLTLEYRDLKPQMVE